MKKTLTISIAAYNVEKFIKNTLESLLIDDMDDLEILVQDDDGTDSTSEIVKQYEIKYQGIVKLVHKENGGYGSTINSSIQLAQGKYFKQLDGDDWYEKENFEKFLKLLRTIDSDVVYTPYILYNVNKDTYEITDYLDENINGQFDIDEILMKAKRYANMYTLAYKTQILKENNIKLLEKCLYTDTEYAMYPIVYCNTMYVTHIPLYVYRIGRGEQSVSVENRIKHYNEHIKVTKRNVEFFKKIKDSYSPSKIEYTKKYVSYMTANSIGSFLIILTANKENLNKIKEFDKYLKDTSQEIYIETENTSRLVKLLRKSHYKLYPILSYYKRRKLNATR